MELFYTAQREIFVQGTCGMGDGIVHVWQALGLRHPIATLSFSSNTNVQTFSFRGAIIGNTESEPDQWEVFQDGSRRQAVRHFWKEMEYQLAKEHYNTIWQQYRIFLSQLLAL